MRQEVELENNLSEHISWKKPIHICSLFKLKLLWVALTRHIPHNLACVASVSVWLRSTERQTNGILGFGRARNETRAKTWKRGEGGGERRKKGQTILNCLAYIGQLSQLMRASNVGVQTQSWQTQVGGFQNLEVCLPAFPSFLLHPSPLFYLHHFSHGLWLSSLVLCS